MTDAMTRPDEAVECDDRAATELWDALRRGVYRSEGPDVALEGYRDVLAALEEAQSANRINTATVAEVLRKALATEQARIQEALNG